MPTTKKQRQELLLELSRKTRAWLVASDDELLAELKQAIPAVTEATREECVRTLTLMHVERMV